MPLTIIIVFSLILGASVGSFLNVVILRLPEEDASIVFPASRCPKCLQVLKWYDNIPVISFLLLKKRCRYCGEPISWQYPLVELTMALLAVALLFKFGFTENRFTSVSILSVTDKIQLPVVDLYQKQILLILLSSYLSRCWSKERL